MGHPPLTPQMTQQLAYSVLTEEQRKRFETTKELDLSFGVPGLSRFRANVFLQRGVTSMAIRQIPYEIFSCEQLGRTYAGKLIVRPTPNPNFRRVDARILDADGLQILLLSTILGR